MSKYIIPASRKTLSIALVFTVVMGLSAAQESDTARAVTRAQVVSVVPAASVSAASTPKRLRAYSYAKTKRGEWFCMGGEGGPGCGHPHTWDCSGLIYVAYKRVGINIPRTTGGMAASSRLVRISKSQAHSGDIALWFDSSGAYHAEFYSSSRYSFGAHHSHTTVGWRLWWGSPRYYHVRGAG